MPKGVKYNYEILLPRDQVYIKENKTIAECVKEINEVIEEHYFIDNSINRSKLFNIMKRPNMVNKFLKTRVKCTKIEK